VFLDQCCAFYFTRDHAFFRHGLDKLKNKFSHPPD
jgi:hypothetical protein